MKTRMWEEKFDEKESSIYYENLFNGKSQWEVKGARSLSLSHIFLIQIPASQFILCKDDERDALYWWDSGTGNSHWANDKKRFGWLKMVDKKTNRYALSPLE